MGEVPPVDGSSATPRDECARCRRPVALCYCAHLTQLETRTRVVILQHPRERGVAVGTARMASLCLPGSEIHVGADFRDAPWLATLLADRAQPAALLYPGEGAIDVVAHPPERPITLVVVDGTWAHARKLVRTHPALAALPRYSFVPAAPSEYRIRREPSPEYVSTIESLVYVLGALEGDPERFTALLAPFRAMVEAQLEHARRSTGGRKRRRRRPQSLPRAPDVLRERAARIVCVAGEANQWPFGHPRRPPGVGEIVHWLAHRPATGETFEAVIAPRGELAPSTTVHVELSTQTLEGGMSLDAFREAWHAFVRDDDVLCGWGQHTFGLLASVGASAGGEVLDLRSLVRVLENRRIGRLESFHAELGCVPALVRPGRGGRRIGMCVDVVRALMERR